MNLAKSRPSRQRIALLMVFPCATFFFVLMAASRGRSAEAEIQVPCLGQTPPGTNPKVFAPDIVSTPAHEFGCSFTPDGKEFYFTRRDPNRGLNLIMVSKCINGTWTKPTTVPFIENWEAFEPRVTPDGRRLYYTSNKPLPGEGGIPMNIWYVEKAGEGWSSPQNPGPPFNPMKSMYVSMTLDGTIYTTDISGGPGSEGIAVAKRFNGEYRKLERLGPPINIGKQDMYPFIAPDESYLIFTSRRPPTNTGGGLWISFKQPDGTWSDPRAIDLGMAAGLPLISPDGKYLFFTGGERGKSDIYWVEARFIEELKSAPSGKIQAQHAPTTSTAAEVPELPLDSFIRTENRPAAKVTADATNPPQYYQIPEVTREGKEHLVDVGGRKLHARVFGQGSPTVVLLSGFNAPQTTWNVLVDPLAEAATVVTYDRAGYGKSDIGDKPTHARQSALDLRRLLQELGVPKPYILVGHSYGVRVARLYASLFHEGLGGLILMDGSHPGLLEAQKKILTGPDLELLERMTSKSPAPANPRTEADYVLLSLEQEKEIGPLPRIPYLVLIAGAGRENGVPPGFSPEARRTMSRLGLEMQKKKAEDIQGGKYIVFEDLGHVMHLENAEPIIRVIKEMIAQIKSVLCQNPVRTESIDFSVSGGQASES
jgi:pimeloyl-ACP methyl ester carboxylesterase